MHAWLPPEAAPVEVDRVEWVPATPEVVHVHVYGRWREHPVEPVALRVDEHGQRREIAAAPDVPPGVLLRFAVPIELRPALMADLALVVGNGAIALPPATPGRLDGPGNQASAEVIDRTVLLERRARRAELSTEALQRRVEEAEQAGLTLEAQLANLEERLAAVRDERSELESQLAAAEERLRAAREREHVEQQQRIEAEDRLARLRETTDAEIAELRRRLSVAHERAEELAQEVDTARRATVEAERQSRLAQEAGAGMAALRDERDAAAARVSLLEHELERRRLVHERLGQELDAVRSELERTAEATATAPAGSAVGAANEQLLAILGRELERAHQEADRLRDEAERAREELARERANPARTQDQSGLLVVAQQVDTIERHLAALRAELSGATSRLREDLAIERGRGQAMESELARLREQLQAARSRPLAGAPETTALVADLAAAAERLREEAEPLEDEVEEAAEPVAEVEPERVAEAQREAPADEPPAERESEATAPPAAPTPDAEPPAPEAPTAPEAETPAPPAPEAHTEAPPEPPAETVLPTALEVVAGPPRTSPWLARAIHALAAQEPSAAARLVVSLLPVQRLRADRAVTYAVTLEGFGTFQVGIRPGWNANPPEGDGAPGRALDFHMAGRPAQFAEFAAGGSGRRPRGVRVTGSKRSLRILARGLQRPVQLADLQAAGVVLDPGLVLMALCLTVDPRVTVGHSFVVGFDVSGDDGGQLHVRVLNGMVPTVGEGIPESADATIHVPDRALAALLGGIEMPEGTEATVTGDAAVAERLRTWFDLAQGVQSTLA